MKSIICHIHHSYGHVTGYVKDVFMILCKWSNTARQCNLTSWMRCILHRVWALFYKLRKGTLPCVDSNASTESFNINCDFLKFTHINLAVRMPACISQTMTFIPVYKPWSVSDLSSPNFNKSHTSEGLGTERQSAKEGRVSERAS